MASKQVKKTICKQPQMTDPNDIEEAMRCKGEDAVDKDEASPRAPPPSSDEEMIPDGGGTAGHAAEAASADVDPLPAPPARLDEPAPPPAAGPSAPQHVAARSVWGGRDPRKYEFCGVFTQIVAFKSFFENLGSVLHEVTLEVRNEPNGGFKGLVADSMDARGVALVHGKLAAQVELNVPVASFCINVRDILDIFPNVHPQHFLKIYRLEGSTDITLHVYEPSIRTTSPSIQIKTLARQIETLELDEMYYSYYVEIELAAFRNALKTAKSQKATAIQLCIYETEKNLEASGETKKTIWFVVKYSGERTSSSFPFESKILVSPDAGGPMTIKALEGGSVSDGDEEDLGGEGIQERLDDLKPSYEGSFLAEYLYLFVKAMDRFNITLRLAHDKPLIVDYPLGCSSTDGLRYVLAPMSGNE